MTSSSSSTVVDPSASEPKVVGSNPATAQLQEKKNV